MTPSSLATAMLNTVRRTRKNECVRTISVSFEHKCGNAMRNRIARNCFRNAASMFGFALTAEGMGGKYGASDANASAGVA
jgi:hypothetical protein